MWTSHLCLFCGLSAAALLAFPSRVRPTWAAPKRTVARSTGYTGPPTAGGGFRAEFATRAHEPRALDLEPEIRLAAAAMEGLARDYFVRLTLAVGPGSFAYVDPGVPRKVLQSVLSNAILAGFGGRVLVTATKSADQLHIRIVDDAFNADQKRRKGLMWEQQELIATQHGSIDVETLPGGGTAVTIRLPAPIQVPEPSAVDMLVEQEA